MLHVIVHVFCCNMPQVCQAMQALVISLTLLGFISQVCGDFINPLNYIRHERAVIRIDESITIEVSPQLLSKAGQWVNVTWYNPNPRDTDWIGAYLARGSKTIDPWKHAPFKFQFADIDPNYLSSGNGFCQFQLINMRQDVLFGFFSGNVTNPKLHATSQPVQFKDPNEILQVHLAQGRDSSEMVVVWSTKNTTNNMVCYGDLVDHGNCIPATVSSYAASDLCYAPANSTGWSNPGQIVTATMTGLKPSTLYYYVLGSNKSSIPISRQYSFRTPPDSNPNAGVSIIAYGDMGFGRVDHTNSFTRFFAKGSLNTSRLVLSEVNAGKVDIILHIGDLSYAMGYSSDWDEFFYQIEPVASQVPYMVCDGNHETDSPNSSSYYTGTDSGGECGVPYEKRFVMPRPAINKHWYGFDYGNVHVVMMSTEQDFTANSEQLQFLDNHLKTVNREKTPWLIFAGHRPMYVDSTYTEGRAADQPVATLLRKYVEPLLKKYGVNLALWGHNHSYQRTCPVYNETCTSDGTTHVVIGMAGALLSENMMPVTPKWIEFQNRQLWGYSSIRTTSNKLEFQFIRDTDGNVYDSFMLEL